MVKEMSSKITTIYDKLVEVLTEMYPDRQRIPYAYSLPDNNKLFYQNGWGLKIGDSSPENIDFCTFTNNRQISVVLTRELTRLQSDSDAVDETVKAMLEDVYDIQKRFYAYDELDIETAIAKVDLGSVVGPTELLTDKQSFLTIEINFNFFIREELGE